MMLASLDLVVGAVVGILPAWVVSRLVLWALRAWQGGPTRLIVGHAVSWVLCSLAAAPLFEVSDQPYGLRAAVVLAFPQLCVLLFDAVRQHRPQPSEGESRSAPKRRTLIARKLSTG
jgi:hypothetical protein